MDRRERSGDPEETQRIAMEGQQGKVWTALPGIIESFDPAAMTCKVQPAINGARSMVNGDIQAVQMPVLLDCPVCFPGGGGVTMTFPIKPGDECLVVFASRCIDSWWQLGGVQGQAEIRMHDLSDGFVLPGVRSQPRKFNVSTSAAQIRTDDGSAYVEINTTSKVITINTPASINVNAGGNASVVAAGTATIQAASIILKNAGTALRKICTELFMTLYNGHTHPQSGGGNTLQPNQQAASGTHTTNTVQAE
jgi:hypothetical protein